MSLVLALNVGSSSLKFAAYRFGGAEARAVSGVLDRIGGAGHFRAERGDGTRLADEPADLPDLAAAVSRFLGWLPEQLGSQRIAAVGHRVVHGGRTFDRPLVVTREILASLRELVPFAPLHQPAALAAIEAAQRACRLQCNHRRSHQSLRRRHF